MNWFVEVHFEPVTTDSQTLKAFNQACKKEMKASCIHEGQINIYPPHLHDDCATLVQTQRDASKQKT